MSEPVYYLNGKTSLVILPSDNLFMSYAVNYNHTDLTRRFVNYDPKKKEEIIEARTFGFYHDLKKFQMLGFAQGVTEENTVGLTDEGGYTTELRSEHEPIKHKMLDLVGDLYLGPSLSRSEQLTHNLQVQGSIPCGPTIWRVNQAVEGIGLENRQGLAARSGSNPLSSAI